MLKLDTLRGFLLTAQADYSAVIRHRLRKCDVIAGYGQMELTRWEQFVLLSKKPLLRYDEPRRQDGYSYPVVIRLSGPRVLLLAQRRKVVEHFIAHVVPYALQLPLHRVQIGIDGLVRKVTGDPGEYALTFVHARVPAFGNDLRAISFYGDDVANAKFFRDGLELMSCHTCGLRHVAGGAEIIRLRNDGGVTFYYSGPTRLLEVEEALKHVSQQGLLGQPDLEASRQF